MHDVKGLNLQPVDGRTVRLHVPLSYREEVNGTDIVRLHNEEETIEIKIGSSVTYRKTKHKVNVITRGIHEGKLICYDLKCAKLTSSSTFALPFFNEISS